MSHFRDLLPCVLAALVGPLAGCTGWSGHSGTYRAPRVGKRARFEATYQFGDPGHGWRPAGHLEDVQVAWHNRGIPAVIEIHSQCEEHGDSSLQQFTDHLRIDHTNWQVLEQHEERLVGRAALRTVVEAELDGVKFKHELVVLKKNGCLFDLRYSSPPAAFERGRASFHAVVRGFRFPVD